MKYPFPYISRQSLLIVLVGVTYTIMQSVALEALVPFGFKKVLLKSALDAIILAVMVRGLYFVIPTSNYVRLDVVQRVINVTALGIITIFLWTAFFYATSLLVFGKDSKTVVQPILPTAVFMGILLYIIIVQRIMKIVEQNMPEEPGSMIDPEKVPNEALQPVPSELNGNNDIEPLERVVVRTGQKIHVIPVHEIVYIQSDKDYVQIVTDQGKFLKEETMKYFENHLPTSSFLRVHRSYIVHIQKMARIEAYGKQNQLLILKNGDKIKVSAAGYKKLREVLGL